MLDARANAEDRFAALRERFSTRSARNEDNVEDNNSSAFISVRSGRNGAEVEENLNLSDTARFSFSVNRNNNDNDDTTNENFTNRSSIFTRTSSRANDDGTNEIETNTQSSETVNTISQEQNITQAPDLTSAQERVANFRARVAALQEEAEENSGINESSAFVTVRSDGEGVDIENDINISDTGELTINPTTSTGGENALFDNDDLDPSFFEGNNDAQPEDTGRFSDRFEGFETLIITRGNDAQDAIDNFVENAPNPNNIAIRVTSQDRQSDVNELTEFANEQSLNESVFTNANANAELV